MEYHLHIKLQLELWHCWIISFFFHEFRLFISHVIQDSLQHCDVDDYSGSLPAGLYSPGHKCISSQACQSPWRCTTWGARQILFCTETLHQSHYKTEVSSWMWYLESTDIFWKCVQISIYMLLDSFWWIGMGKETPQILYLQMCWWGRAQRVFQDPTMSGKLFQN